MVLPAVVADIRAKTKMLDPTTVANHNYYVEMDSSNVDQWYVARIRKGFWADADINFYLTGVHGHFKNPPFTTKCLLIRVYK